MNNFIIAQIFGLIALLSSIIAICQKTRNKYIVFNIIQNVFSAVQYLLLTKSIACYLCILSILRLFVYSFRNRFNKYLNVFILIFFLTANILVSVISYSNIFDLIPIIASTLVCYTVWQNNLFIIRLGVLISKIMWGIFATISLAYFSILMDIFLIIWTLYVIFKDKKHNNYK
ncbi:MAG: YgjV family protein [Clostridiales bacterium]|nr:YgjV family protein [Clostridiales bacterium]